MRVIDKHSMTYRFSGKTVELMKDTCMFTNYLPSAAWTTPVKSYEFTYHAYKCLMICAESSVFLYKFYLLTVVAQTFATVRMLKKICTCRLGIALA